MTKYEANQFGWPKVPKIRDLTSCIQQLTPTPKIGPLCCNPGSATLIKRQLGEKPKCSGMAYKLTKVPDTIIVNSKDLKFLLLITIAADKKKIK